MVVIIAGLAGMIYIWLNYGSSPKAADAPTLSKNSNGRITLDGTVAAAKSADLGFVLPAKITALPKKVGDVVKAGEVLAIQDNADVKAQIGAAQASLESSRSELDLRQHDLKKEKLKVHDFSGNARKEQRQQVSSSEDNVEVQKSIIVAAQNDLAAARAQLDKTILKAPFDGLITRQDGEIGEVSGSAVPSFLTVASNDPAKNIEAFASELDVAKIKVGDAAEVSLDIQGEQKTIKAEVISVDPNTTSFQGKQAYKIKLKLAEENENIKLGMHASVSF